MLFCNTVKAEVSEFRITMISLPKIFVFSYQRTPLHVAAHNGRDYTVECLAKKGPNVSIKDKNGVSITKDRLFEYQTLSMRIVCPSHHHVPWNGMACPTMYQTLT